MLKLENVSYRYKKGDRDVLSDINVTFENNKFTSIVGPSGSGKTTLLSIMAGLDKPTGGDVMVDGDSLSKINLDAYRRERISIVFQAFQLFPLLTALENVCYPMEISGATPKYAAERAAELLNSVGIDDSKHKRYPSNLSGGEQQRIAIARALSTNANVILADEPTGNLDKDNGDAVVDILKKLAHEQGYCVVIVTHNQEIADASDAVYRISDGKIFSV